MNDKYPDVTGAMDSPRPTDYSLADIELAGSTDDDIKWNWELVRPELIVWNQSEHTDTRMACTRYAMMLISNAQNINEGRELAIGFIQKDPRPIWLEAVEKNPHIATHGDYLQNALDDFRARGLIAGYAQAMTYELLDEALDSGRLIYTGSRDGDWRETRRTGIYTRASSPTTGHAFCLVKRVGQDYLAINSYGPTFGYFIVRRVDIPTLFTRYAILDARDEQALQAYRQRQVRARLQVAIDRGYYSGTRPHDTMTREEAMTVITRVLMDVDEGFRSEVEKRLQ